MRARQGVPLRRLPWEMKARWVSQPSRPSKMWVAYTMVAPLTSHSCLPHPLLSVYIFLCNLLFFELDIALLSSIKITNRID